MRFRSGRRLVPKPFMARPQVLVKSIPTPIVCQGQVRQLPCQDTWKGKR